MIAPFIPYRKEIVHINGVNDDMKIPSKVLPSAITVSDKRFATSHVAFRLTRTDLEYQ